MSYLLPLTSYFSPFALFFNTSLTKDGIVLDEFCKRKVEILIMNHLTAQSLYVHKNNPDTCTIYFEMIRHIIMINNVKYSIEKHEL